MTLHKQRYSLTIGFPQDLKKKVFLGLTMMVSCFYVSRGESLPFAGPKQSHCCTRWTGSCTDRLVKVLSVGHPPATGLSSAVTL